MDMKRKKELLETYKNRKPEMGILAFCCIAAQKTFLCSSKDINASINRNRLQLSIGQHPNGALQSLWNQFGESGFEISTMQQLKYKDPNEDHADELKKMLDQCIEANPAYRRIYP